MIITKNNWEQKATKFLSINIIINIIESFFSSISCMVGFKASFPSHLADILKQSRYNQEIKELVAAMFKDRGRLVIERGWCVR